VWTCRRRGPAGLVGCPMVVMRYVYGPGVSDGWARLIDLL
jgi:hypothetical protein